MRISDWSSDVCSSDLKLYPEIIAVQCNVARTIGHVDQSLVHLIGLLVTIRPQPELTGCHRKVRGNDPIGSFCLNPHIQKIVIPLVETCFIIQRKPCLWVRGYFELPSPFFVFFSVPKDAP